MSDANRMCTLVREAWASVRDRWKGWDRAHLIFSIVCAATALASFATSASGLGWSLVGLVDAYLIVLLVFVACQWIEPLPDRSTALVVVAFLFAALVVAFATIYGTCNCFTRQYLGADPRTATITLTKDTLTDHWEAAYVSLGVITTAATDYTPADGEARFAVAFETVSGLLFLLVAFPILATRLGLFKEPANPAADVANRAPPPPSPSWTEGDAHTLLLIGHHDTWWAKGHLWVVANWALALMGLVTGAVPVFNLQQDARWVMGLVAVIALAATSYLARLQYDIARARQVTTFVIEGRPQLHALYGAVKRLPQKAAPDETRGLPFVGGLMAAVSIGLGLVWFLLEQKPEQKLCFALVAGLGNLFWGASGIIWAVGASMRQRLCGGTLGTGG